MHCQLVGKGSSLFQKLRGKFYTTSRSSLNCSDRTLFLRNHVELKKTSESDVYRLRPSYYLLDTIGDITSINMCRDVNVSKEMQANQTICTIEWTGYKISAADELYHAIWANSEGVEKISIPSKCHIVSVNSNSDNCATNNNFNDWIVDIEISKNEMASMSHLILDEDEYDEYCDTL